MRVRVDPAICQGHTLCALNTPEAFDLSDENGHAIVRFSEVPTDLEQAVRDAAATCPEGAIILADDRLP